MTINSLLLIRKGKDLGSLTAVIFKTNLGVKSVRSVKESEIQKVEVSSKYDNIRIWKLINANKPIKQLKQKNYIYRQ